MSLLVGRKRQHSDTDGDGDGMSRKCVCMKIIIQFNVIISVEQCTTLNGECQPGRI